MRDDLIPTKHVGGPADGQNFEVPACFRTWHHQGGQYARTVLLQEARCIAEPTMTRTIDPPPPAHD